MLLKGSIMRCSDNSGCGTIKIIQLYSINMSQAGQLIRCVMHKFNPNRNKLVKKKHYWVACVATVREVMRKCAVSVYSSINKIVLLSDNRKRLLGTRILGAIQREVRNLKLDISVIHRIILFSRLII